LTHGYAENSRGIGVADMAYALRSGRKQRVTLESTCTRPATLPLGLLHG